MDCSKSVSAEFYRTTTDDEGVLSPFEDLGSDSDRGGHFSEARKTKSDISYSSINTSFSSLPFPRTEKPENTIPAVYRLKYANQYVGSYLKPERDFKAKTADAAFIGSLLQSPNSNKLPNGSKVNVNGGIKPNCELILSTNFPFVSTPSNPIGFSSLKVPNLKSCLNAYALKACCGSQFHLLNCSLMPRYLKSSGVKESQTSCLMRRTSSKLDVSTFRICLRRVLSSPRRNEIKLLTDSS